MSSLSEKIESAEFFQPDWPIPDMNVLKGPYTGTPELPKWVFGPLTESVIQSAEVKNAPIDYVAMALLSIGATLIGNKRKISPWSGWKESSILWFALVGRPSSGKSPAIDAILEPLMELEKEHQAIYKTQKLDYETKLEIAKQEKALWEQDLKAAVKKNEARPPKPSKACEPTPPGLTRLFVQDATIEALGPILKANPQGILLYRDELAGWLENMNRYSNGSDRTFWLEAFGGRAYTIDRSKYPEPIVIERLSISILGGIQPDKLAKALMSGDDDGLAARLLYSWPEPIPFQLPNVEENPAILQNTFERLHGLNMPETPIVMSLSPEGKELFISVKKELNTLEGEATGLLQSHIGKLPGITLRLALVFELLWWGAGIDKAPPIEISEKAVKASRCLVIDYFIPMACRAFGDATIPENEKNAMAMARWIHKHRPQKINVRELTRARIAGMSEAGVIRAALEVLEEHSWIKAAPVRHGETSGRKRNDYRVNPRIWEK